MIAMMMTIKKPMIVVMTSMAMMIHGDDYHNGDGDTGGDDYHGDSDGDDDNGYGGGNHGGDDNGDGNVDGNAGRSR